MHARILKPETHWPVREGNGNFRYFEVETKNKLRMGDHYQLSNNKLQSITPIFLTSYSVLKICIDICSLHDNPPWQGQII